VHELGLSHIHREAAGAARRKGGGVDCHGVAFSGVKIRYETAVAGVIQKKDAQKKEPFSEERAGG
jgi:hypothetical protein